MNAPELRVTSVAGQFGIDRFRTGYAPDMARPREFDEDEVIDRARTAFWSQGVAATSISALSEATGLSVGSLYKAFSSKDELCSITLDDYLRRARAQVAATLDGAPSPRAGIRAWLDSAIAQATDASPTRGCYAVELATERAGSYDDVRTLLVDHDRAMRRLVSDAVGRAVDAGDLSGDPDAVALLLCTTVNGLMVEARKGISDREARSVVDTMRGGSETS